MTAERTTLEQPLPPAPRATTTTTTTQRLPATSIRLTRGQLDAVCREAGVPLYSDRATGHGDDCPIEVSQLPRALERQAPRYGWPDTCLAVTDDPAHAAGLFRVIAALDNMCRLFGEPLVMDTAIRRAVIETAPGGARVWYLPGVTVR